MAKTQVDESTIATVSNFIEANWQRFIAYLETEEGQANPEEYAEEIAKELRAAAGYSD